MTDRIGRNSRTWLYASFGLLAIAGCDPSPSGPSMVDSGSWYRSGYQWPHDGNPYETANFVVYSDGASLEARQKVAEIGEELLAVLKSDFEVSTDMLRFPVGQSKIHVFAYKNHSPQQWGGWGYYGGLLIFSLDHEWRTQIGGTEIGNYTRVLTHELMHVVEGLLKGTDNPNLVDVWLTEGIAEYVSGGTAGGSIEDIATLDARIARWGNRNPIAMHQYRYPDIEGIAFNYYYPMFELSVRYLLDPEGAANQKPAIRDLFLDARQGIDFATAFQNRFGIDLQDFETGFFDRIRAFLP
jgi:hypothetical protein